MNALSEPLSLPLPLSPSLEHGSDDGPTESLSLSRIGGVALSPAPQTARTNPQVVRLWRYLPLALCTTVAVTVVPVALTAMVVPSGGPLLMVLSAAVAVALSVAVANGAAAVWKRWPRSRDIVFADLMLWGWLRRWWTERRLDQTRALYESTKKASPDVSIELLERLSRLLEARDVYTHGHSQRVARQAGRIAHAMRLSPTEIAKIRTAAAVHDIGKLYTPREIINNPRPLTDAEFGIVKRHPVDGANMLADAGDPEITAMVRHHHERLDGRGYPDGLVGEQIPLGARIIAVADTFDAITSSRAYRSARIHKMALDILSKEAGTQLDGAAVAAFLQSYSARRPVAWFAFATAVPQRIVAWLQTSASGLGLTSGWLGPTLPALSAAGAIALSAGLHHDALAARYAQPRSVNARSHRQIVTATPTTASLLRAGKRNATVAPPARLHHQGSVVTGASPATPTSTRAVADAPSTPGAGHTTSTANAPPSAGAVTTEVPAGAASPPTSTTTTPTASTPPTTTAPSGSQTSTTPASPVTPSKPPVSVNPPSVEVSVPLPGSKTPAVEVTANAPSGKLPTVEVSVPVVGAKLNL